MRKAPRRDIGVVIIERGPSVLFVWMTVVFLLGMFRGQTSVSRYLSLKDSELILSKTVNDLERENKKLEVEILKLKKSKDYARKVLRDKYHVTEGDEKIIYFAD